MTQPQPKRPNTSRNRSGLFPKYTHAWPCDDALDPPLTRQYLTRPDVKTIAAADSNHFPTPGHNLNFSRRIRLESAVVFKRFSNDTLRPSPGRHTNTFRPHQLNGRARLWAIGRPGRHRVRPSYRLVPGRSTRFRQE